MRRIGSWCLGALEARARLEDGLVWFLGCLRKGVLDRVRVDLNRALPAMIPALAREVGEGTRLRVAPTAGPLPIEANVTLLERALVHLVQNAREASGPEQTFVCRGVRRRRERGATRAGRGLGSGYRIRGKEFPTSTSPGSSNPSSRVGLRVTP